MDMKEGRNKPFVFCFQIQCSGLNGWEQQSRCKRDEQIQTHQSCDCHLPVVYAVTLIADAMESGRQGSMIWGTAEGEDQSERQPGAEQTWLEDATANQHSSWTEEHHCKSTCNELTKCPLPRPPWIRWCCPEDRREATLPHPCISVHPLHLCMDASVYKIMW